MIIPGLLFSLSHIFCPQIINTHHSNKCVLIHHWRLSKTVQTIWLCDHTSTDVGQHVEV